MKPNASHIPDPTGVRGLPRSGIAAERALAQILAVSSGQGIDAIVATHGHFKNLSKERRDQITRVYGANEVPATALPESTADAQLAAAIQHVSFLGGLTFATNLPPNTFFKGIAAAVPNAAIIPDGHAIPLRAGAFQSVDMTLRTAKALMAASVQWCALPGALKTLDYMLTTAAGRAIDADALTVLLGSGDPLAGAESPAALLLRIRDAVASLVAAGAAPEGIVLVANPLTALAIGTYPGFSDFAFNGVGIHGGQIAGLKLITSQGATVGSLYVISSDGVGRCILPPTTDASKAGQLEFSSLPTGKTEPGETPVAASATRVNLWQSDFVALRIYAPYSVAAIRDLVAIEITDVLPEIETV